MEVDNYRIYPVKSIIDYIEQGNQATAGINGPFLEVVNERLNILEVNNETSRIIF